jgi:hypothetical protein
MLRQIIIPSATNYAVILPEMYYGKKIIVTVAAIEEKVDSSKDFLAQAKKARAFFNSIKADMTEFKFDREEANER